MTDINAAAALLREHDNIMILTHRKPDGDTLGSAFALSYALKQLGKNCAVANSDIIPPKLRMLTGGESELPEMADPDFIVSIDVAEAKLLGDKLEKYGGKVDLCIDHHKTNEHYAAETYVDSGAAAVGEIVYDIILSLGAEITPQIAAAIYIAVSTDTGCFKFRNTTPKSMRTAADMMEKGIDAPEINKVFFQTVSKNRVLLLKEMYSHMEMFESGALAVSYLGKHDYPEDDYDGLASILSETEGVMAATLLRESEPGEYRMSVRGKKGFDCSALCKRYNGGGHEGAAGADIYGTLEFCLADLKASMTEEYYRQK